LPSPDPTIIRAVAQALVSAPRIAVLTGAGVSAESGIPTFRSGERAHWKNLRPEQLASLDGFQRDPQTVWSWYQYRRRTYAKCLPNPGHLALAELERRRPDLTLITQNVDRLHQRAGSTNVIELHGNAVDNHCFRCSLPAGEVPVDSDDLVACSACGGWLRPSVVWFGEMLPVDALERASAAASACDVFLSIGTSAQVYPAAQLPALARHRGALLVEINPEPTPITPLAKYVLPHPSGEVLPLILTAMSDPQG
jgi:NAD-dependent deacetylase